MQGSTSVGNVLCQHSNFSAPSPAVCWYVGEATEVVVVASLLVKSSPAILSKELLELVHVKQDEIQLLVKTVL